MPSRIQKRESNPKEDRLSTPTPRRLRWQSDHYVQDDRYSISTVWHSPAGGENRFVVTVADFETGQSVTLWGDEDNRPTIDLAFDMLTNQKR